jgi:hypothetical protein
VFSSLDTKLKWFFAGLENWSVDFEEKDVWERFIFCETTVRDAPTAKRAIGSSLRRSSFPLRKLVARFWSSVLSDVKYFLSYPASSRFAPQGLGTQPGATIPYLWSKKS